MDQVRGPYGCSASIVCLRWTGNYAASRSVLTLTVFRFVLVGRLLFWWAFTRSDILVDGGRRPYLPRMASNTLGSTRVEVSPRSRPSATSRKRRRMILPDRVFGSSGTIVI